MREEYLREVGIIRCREEALPCSMPSTTSGGGAGFVAASASGVSRSPTTNSPTLVSQTSNPEDTLQVSLELEHHHHHHHHHHPVHHNTHKHFHNGSVAETVVASGTPISAFVGRGAIAGFDHVPALDIAGTSPPGGRGRSRIVRRVPRSSSSESTCSSKTSSKAGEQDAALLGKVTELVGLYHKTGEYGELSRTARDNGIPAQLRRVCSNYIRMPLWAFSLTVNRLYGLFSLRIIPL